MKKFWFLMPLIAVVLSFSSPVSADDDDDYDDDYSYSQPGENYYPQPQSQQGYYNDQRSTHGLAVGVLGGVLGYEVDTLFKVNLISLIYGYSADAGIA